MKRREGEMKCSSPPPRPPPEPKMWSPKPVKVVCWRSETRVEIERFWRRKKMEEEDHLLAAIKAAASIRARNLTEEDYSRFEKSLEKEEKKDEKKDDTTTVNETRIGIKDWWTKSKYAYLNQPALKTMDKAKGTSTYTPNLCFYKPSPQPHSSMGFYVF